MTIEIAITIIVQLAGFAYLFGSVSARTTRIEREIERLIKLVQILATDMNRHLGEHEAGRRL